MKRKREDIPLALDAALSGLQRDPALFQSVINASKGDVPPVKRKLTTSLALALVLVLLGVGAAAAAAWRGVSWFLTEKTDAAVSLDPNYLLTEPKQHHNSKYLNAAIVDAYWDGLEFSVVYHVSPVNSAQVLAMQCTKAEHTHTQQERDADIRLLEPAFISLTDQQGKLTEPRYFTCDWVHETDGSVSVLITLQCYDMSQPVSIGIPIFNTLSESGYTYHSVLHYKPVTLTDPLADHDHQWQPATCVSLKICTVCRRTEEGLGPHLYRLSRDGAMVLCDLCGKELNRPTHVPAGNTLRPGDQDVFVLALQLKLQEMGFYNGPLSGLYDDETQEAVKACQESLGLHSDGMCGRETTEKLFP